MDDPIFDPWDAVGGTPPTGSHPTARWRSPARVVPELPATTPRRSGLARTASPGRTRLAGTPGFLRTMAIPRLEDIVQRLRMARHMASLEDRLHDSPPVIRLTVRPWHGPLAELPAVEGLLEISIEREPEEGVEIRYSIAPSSGASLLTDRISAAKLGAPWLEGRVLAFIEALLGRV